MFRLLAVVGFTGLLIALLSFGFEGIPLGSAEGRRRRAIATPPSDDATDEPTVPVTEPAPAEPAPSPVPTHRGRWQRWATKGLGWPLYLAFVVGAIVTIPNALGWALNSPNPIAAVTGSSMWPTLTKGDIVFLQGVDGVEDLRVGDIIAFRQDQRFSIHRIVRIEGPTITTRGDGNLVNDPPIRINDVIGKVPTVFGRLARVPFLGYLSFILGPLLQKDNDFGPLETQPLSQSVPDLSKEETGRLLGPLEDLSSIKRLEEEADSSSDAGSPISDLRQTGQTPASPPAPGVPIKELVSTEQ